MSFESRLHKAITPLMPPVSPNIVSSSRGLLLSTGTIPSAKQVVPLDYGTAKHFMRWIGPTAWTLFLSNERLKRSGAMCLPDELMFLVLANMFHARTAISRFSWDPEDKLSRFPAEQMRVGWDPHGIITQDMFGLLMQQEAFSIVVVGYAPCLSQRLYCGDQHTALFKEYFIDDKHVAASGPIYFPNEPFEPGETDVIDSDGQIVPSPRFVLSDFA